MKFLYIRCGGFLKYVYDVIVGDYSKESALGIDDRECLQAGFGHYLSDFFIFGLIVTGVGDISIHDV